MARPSGISYYESKHGYYTWLKDKRHKLYGPCDDDRPAGPNFRQAQEEYTRLTTTDTFNPFLKSERMSYVIERYLRHLEYTESRSLQLAKSLLSRWSKGIGHLDAAQLDGSVIMAYLEQQKRWKAATSTTAYSLLRACLNYSVRMRFLAENPLRDWILPQYLKPVPRGPEFFLPVGLADEIVRLSGGGARAIVRALATTGARPGEITNADWFNWDAEQKCIHYDPNPKRGYTWKNGGKRKKNPKHRYIFLIDELAEQASRNAQRRQPLFPANHGRFMGDTGLDQHFTRLRTRGAIPDLLHQHGRTPEVIIPYALRHTWITNALRRDVAIKKVADLCGTSVGEIEETYSHVLADLPSLRQAFLDAQ